MGDAALDRSAPRFAVILHPNLHRLVAAGAAVVTDDDPMDDGVEKACPLHLADLTGVESACRLLANQATRRLGMRALFHSLTSGVWPLSADAAGIGAPSIPTIGEMPPGLFGSISGSSPSRILQQAIVE